MVVCAQINVQWCNDKLDVDVGTCTSCGAFVNNAFAWFGKAIVVQDKLFASWDVLRDCEECQSVNFSFDVSFLGGFGVCAHCLFNVVADFLGDQTRDIVVLPFGSCRSQRFLKGKSNARVPSKSCCKL